MKNKLNKSIHDKAPFGYAYHKIILDDLNRPIDYEFIDVNPQFELITGLKASAIIGKSICNIMPGIRKENFDWITYYGEIALNGGSGDLEQYSEQLKKWYKVQVSSPEKLYFVTYFVDITSQKILLDSAQQFLMNSNENINYQKLCEDLQIISGALAVSFNLFNENSVDFTTVGISGINETLKKISSFIGFEIVGKQWKHDSGRAEKIKEKSITKFSKLYELAGNTIPLKIISILENTFGIGEVYLVKIQKKEQILGDFTLYFRKGNTLKNEKQVDLYAHMVGMLIDQNRISHSLRISEAKSSAILRTLPDMLFIQNSEGVYLDFYLPENTVKFDPPKVFIGQRMENVLPENIIRDLIPIIDKAIQTREIQYYNYSLEMPDKRHYFEARIMSFVKDIFMNIVRDVTNQKEVEIALKIKNEQLIKSDLEKDLFLSILAHDLKNPFNALLGLTELLSENIRKYDIEKIERFMFQIQNTVKNTHYLLEDLLIWAQTQMGKITFKQEELVLHDICNDSITSSKLNAQYKEITISHYIDKEIRVWADAYMIKTIMRNLISNAIKFTKPGGNIDIRAEKSGKKIIISVCDNGIGLATSKLKELFDIAIPQSTPGTAKESGTGLGLFICKEFVEKHDGTIWAESEEGIGSCFKFSLPENKS